MARETRDQELAADGVGGLAVETGTRLRTGRIQAETLGVHRRRHVSRALHRVIDIAADLIHAHDKKHMRRALCNSRHTVAVAVDVDEDAVLRHRIHAAQEIIRVVRQEHRLSLILIRVAVDKVIVAVLQRLGQTDGMHAHGAAHGNRRTLRNQGQCFCQGLFLRLDKEPLHVAGLQSLDHLLRTKSVSL